MRSRASTKRPFSISVRSVEAAAFRLEVSSNAGLPSVIRLRLGAKSVAFWTTAQASSLLISEGFFCGSLAFDKGLKIPKFNKQVRYILALAVINHRDGHRLCEDQ